MGYRHARSGKGNEVTFIETTPMNGGPDFKIRLVPVLGALAPNRREVFQRLNQHGLASTTVDDLLLVVSELCANAIQATARGGAPILLRVQVTDTAVIVEVENAGPPFDSRVLTQRQAGDDTERGRGLVVVRALADEVTFQSYNGRRIVRAVMARG